MGLEWSLVHRSLNNVRLYDDDDIIVAHCRQEILGSSHLNPTHCLLRPFQFVLFPVVLELTGPQGDVGGRIMVW